MKTLLRMLAAFSGLGLLAVTSVRALDFNMDGSTGVVGTVRSGEPASIDDEVLYVNYLLSLGANATVTHDFGGAVGSHDFQTSLVDYNGTVSAADATKYEADDPGFSLSGSGFDFVVAKYDGPNGGDVVWYLGGAAFTLPADSSPMWLNEGGKGFGISHWTGFGSTTSVPDGGTTAILVGLGLVAMNFIARRRRTLV